MLLDYLHNYLLRIKPLYNVDQEMEQVNKEFNQQWEAGTFPGWQVCIYKDIWLIFDDENSNILTTKLIKFLHFSSRKNREVL